MLFYMFQMVVFLSLGYTRSLYIHKTITSELIAIVLVILHNDTGLTVLESLSCSALDTLSG